MDYFDTHCDTAFELFHRKSRLRDGSTHITAEKLAKYGRYAQVFDIWSEKRLSDDEAYARFFEIYDYFIAELAENPEFFLCKSADDIARAEKDGKRAAILGAEGANLLGGDVSRLGKLFSCGLRVLTLTWSGISCIGGAHGTDAGLTDFGRDVVSECERLGVIVDVSHGSDKLTDEATEYCALAKIPAIATHSCSRQCRDHPRNLTDDAAKRIAAAGGIVGMSLCPAHLSDKKEATAEDAVRHICHYLDLGLERNLCIGADLDGTELPAGITDVSSLGSLREAMLRAGISEDMVSAVFYGNARRFFGRYLPKNM